MMLSKTNLPLVVALGLSCWGFYSKPVYSYSFTLTPQEQSFFIQAFNNDWVVAGRTLASGYDTNATFNYAGTKTQGGSESIGNGIEFGVPVSYVFNMALVNDNTLERNYKEYKALLDSR
jgi:hypothetical protein